MKIPTGHMDRKLGTPQETMTKVDGELLEKKKKVRWGSRGRRAR